MKKIKRKLRTGTLLVLGFLIIIITGALFLMLPVSLKDGVRIGLLDALFISTSAVCVTGLTPVVIADTFNFFGRFILCILMQLGGIGFAVVVAGLIMMVGHFVGSKNQLLIKDSLGIDNNKDIITVAKRAIIISFIIESLGVIWLYTIFDNSYKPLEAFGYAVFHSISAYNNAGLDLLGNSLESYSTNVSMNLCISFLIILGGLGFIVYSDLFDRIKKKHLLVHTKIVLVTTLVLIVGGMLLFYFFTDLTLLESYFLSVSSRTAGFDTVPCAELSPFALFLTDVLMFIGASPGSTGGGIKTTTFFTIILTMISLPRGISPHAFKRQLSQNSIMKAFTILGTVFVIIITIFGALLVIEPEIKTEHLFFEVISAFATVGLSCSVTPTLSNLGKVLIMALMFIGRLGPLTITGLINRKTEKLHFLEEKIVTG